MSVTHTNRLNRLARDMRHFVKPLRHGPSKDDLRAMLAQAASNTAALDRDEERSGTNEPETSQRD